MSSPTPPPPMPDPDDDLPRPAPRARRAPPSSSRSAGASGSGPRSRSVWSRLSPRAWAILIAIVLVVLVVVIGTLAGGNDKKKASTIKTEGAATALQRLLDGVDKDTALSACPFGSVTSIADDVKGQVQVGAPLSDALRTIVIGGKDSVDEVLCSASTADDRLHLVHSMYVYATPTPKGSYSDYLSKTLLAGAEVKLEDPVKFGGGTIYAYCITPVADIKGGCGADWVNGDSKLVLGMQVASDTVTAKQVTAALQRELETLANRLGGEEPAGSSVPGTSGTAPGDTSDTPDNTSGTGPATRTPATGTPATGVDATAGSTRSTQAATPTSRPASGSVAT